MAKIIKRLRYGTVVEYEESDPIYSEGWTIGSGIRSKANTAKEETKPAEAQEADDAHENPASDS